MVLLEVFKCLCHVTGLRPDSLGRAMQKRVFEHSRTTKAQISLRIRAVWSGPLVSANIIMEYSWNSKVCMYVEQRFEWCFAHAQEYLNLRIVRILESTWRTPFVVARFLARWIYTSLLLFCEKK